jgi:cell division protein ZapE
VTRPPARRLPDRASLAAPRPAATLDGLVPPPRFGTTSFSAYRPVHPSQAEARATVATFVDEATQRARPRRLRLPWRGPRAGRGLYLDGGFGVGKTHLLAAAWHAAELPARRKRYLSFQELVYLLGVLGREGARDAFADVALLCLDEFELDDPGNTLLIATFLREAFGRGTAVVTTSNTPPEAQGSGRFAAHDFRREIQGIAERFEVVAIDGPDHRAGIRQADWSEPAEARAAAEACPGEVLHATGEELATLLAELHPVRYRELLRGVDLVVLEDLRPIPDQNAALRFVHFVDKLYDLGIGLRASGTHALSETFDAGYAHGAYAKKHLRCLSRLSELLTEEPPWARSDAGDAPAVG